MLHGNGRRRLLALVLAAGAVFLYGLASLSVGGPSPVGYFASGLLSTAAASTMGSETNIYIPLVARNYNAPAVVPRTPTLLGIESPGALDAARMARVSGLEASWIRRNRVDWRTVEATPGTYDWSSADALLNDLAGRGLKVIAIVGGNPPWTGATLNGPLSEAQLPRLAAFLTALVNRYKNVVKYWEFYNEPDGTSPAYEEAIARWGDNGADYARMLRAAYAAIKAADPEAKVVFGSLALDYFSDEGGSFNRNFLETALAEMDRNPGQYFDYMGFHYYPEYDSGANLNRWGKPGWNGWDAERGDRGIVGKASFISRTLLQHGIDKPLLCTEAGLSSEVSRQASDRTADGEEEQARAVPRVFARGAAAGLDGMIWYLLVSSSPGMPPQQDFYAYHGLLDYRLQPNLAYYAYQILSRWLNDTRYVRSLLYQETGSNIVEGYVFRVESTGKEKRIVWANIADPDARMVVFPFIAVRVTQKDGTTTIVRDGQVGDFDGAMNGHVTLRVNGSPQYLEAE